MTRRLFFRLIIAAVVVGAIYRIYTLKTAFPLVHVSGFTMGTISYNVKYLESDAKDYKSVIDSILIVFNQSLSTYIPTSEISRLNQTDTLADPSAMMMDVMLRSKSIYEATEGAFDPTVGPLVNAWGFGPGKKPTSPDSVTIKNLLEKVGFGNIQINASSISMHSGMYVDFSAIAKGYAVDLIGEFLEGKGVKDYLVEIGGEVRAKGQNHEGQPWSIGIEDPIVAREERKLLAIVRLLNKSMATSGNYRNYYEQDGRIIAHTINPKTGYNTAHHLLSASVFAADCMTADAYATAFMVVGLEGSKNLLANPELEAFLVFEEGGKIKSYVSPGLEAFVELNKTDE